MKLFLPVALSLAAFAQSPNPDAFYKLGPDSCPGRRPQRRDSRTVQNRQQGLSRHVPHLLGVRSRAVRSGGSGEPDDLQRRPGVQESRGRRAGAERDGQSDLPARNSGHDRRLHQSRATRPSSPSRTRRRMGRPHHQPAHRIQLARRPLRARHLRRTDAVLYKDYNISKDPERHGIGGASSGAIAAFTVAWERPDEFRKVLSIVGSFVNLRGGHAYPEHRRARATRSRSAFSCRTAATTIAALRANGEYDQTRDWFFQNVRLMKALTEKGYDVNYTWGMNKHGQKMGGRDYARHDALAVARPAGFGRPARHGGAILPRAGQEKLKRRARILCS